MNDYKRWKFLERWGWWQTLAGVVMFIVPILISKPKLHVFLACIMFAGLVMVFVGLFMAITYGGKCSQVEWNEKYVRCPHCGIGWMKRG
jgi:uncharacterized membrane protein HdeD (DUF308 family)